MGIDRRRYSGGYVPLRDAMDQLFAGSFITPQTFGSGGFPQVDLYVTEDDVVLEIATPGADPNDISISATGDSVTISGEVKHSHRKEKGQPLLEEIWTGKFQRSFSVPTQIDPDKAQASFENGILTLVLPKSEATKPRKIQVQGGGQTITQQPGQVGNQTQRETVSVQGGQSS